MQGAMAPRYLGGMAPWCLGALVPWCLGAMVPRCLGSMVPWRHGAMAPRCLGATEAWCLGALVPWRHGALVPRMERTRRLANSGEVSSQHLVGFFKDEFPPTADGFGTGTPVPIPQSQSFSQTYGSILPTSLAYIVPSTIGCSPWRPNAVMSTTGCGRHSVLWIFKGRRERTGHHATCGALPAARPYLRLSRFQGGQTVKQKR
ncbi:hypothetical protein CQW23_34033 [Capsicum baccatum]|uniref:Uncharacterized protein n=1 Tax=Capsicum baccatum TaxID=33114 RepID=A0A2G2V056_CAPBA|nr:hypothetical protein CQW23_34033 [Capsicum baccatum]